MRSFANRNWVLSFGMALTVVIATSVTVNAAIKIQFDMDGGTTPFTQSVGSPGLANGIFTGADTTWNGVSATVATNYSTLKYTDGTTATGVVAQYGATSSTGSPTSPINWNNNTFLGDIGTGTAGLSLYNNAMVQTITYYQSFFNAAGGAVGFQVSGLAPGSYFVYVTAVHPDALFRTYNIGIGANLTQQVGSPIALNGSAASNTWQAGENYALGTVTLTSTSDWLSVISSNLNNFAEINGIQIVTVPEPATLGLLSIGAVALLRRRGRAA